MKKTKLIFLFLLVSLLTFAQDNWKEFKKSNYSIKYPEDWNYCDQKPQPKIEFILKANSKSNKNDRFHENINLNLKTLTKETNLNDHIESKIDQISFQIPNVKINENKSTVINGITAKKLIWSAKLSNGFHLKFKQIILIRNKIAYININFNE